MVLVGLHGLVGSSTTDQLMGELGLVLLGVLGVLVVVFAVASLVGVVYSSAVSTNAEVDGHAVDNAGNDALQRLNIPWNQPMMKM